MKSIFICTSSFAEYSNEPFSVLKTNDYCVDGNTIGRKLNGEELFDFIKDSDAVIAGTEKYERSLLESLPHLKVISRLGVGMDNIDLEAAGERNIKVFKTETTPAPAVAELALGLMLDVARNISHQGKQLTAGIWKKEMGVLLQGKTFGIIGLGTIGKALVKLVEGFNFKILAYDLYHDKAFQIENNITYCDLDMLLNKSDIISIHLNLTDKTFDLINEKRIALMKSEAILINASRGEIIDEKALYNALKNEQILGAGLDVFKEEPYNGPLSELDNVVVTPHIGSYAKEIRIKMEIEAAENVVKGLQNE